MISFDKLIKELRKHHRDVKMTIYVHSDGCWLMVLEKEDKNE